ncbi:MAG: hypothetical protein CBE11_02520 [Rickettsiales bacterium TMED251]|nr:MAG: hypothetical protein CBE11_02520 [Rickettsiales bacterium TMED251]|tara:strand:- start:143 stop:1273 length:1131 start_codon:yes stop_codon:yes gene_type:complete
MFIAALKEDNQDDNRVSVTPETCKKLVSKGFEVIIEKNAGNASNYLNEHYLSAGAEIEENREKILKKTDVLLAVTTVPSESIIKFMKMHIVVIGTFNPYENSSALSKLEAGNLNVITLDFLPRISRAQAMDVLSSQSNLAGYKAVIEAASLFKKALPMMMTAAGTIIPAKCLILGAGVAGLQAIATAKRLGCMVSAFDVRPEVEEQVKSLGSKFIKVENVEQENVSSKGYAKEMDKDYKMKQLEKIHQVAIESDIIITTALIPGKEAPKLLLSKTIKKMKKGSVIIDLAGSAGGNAEGALFGKKIEIENTLIYSPKNLPSLLANDSSLLYSKNVLNFFNQFIGEDKRFDINSDDEILKDTLIIKNGKKTSAFFERK